MEPLTFTDVFAPDFGAELEYPNRLLFPGGRVVEFSYEPSLRILSLAIEDSFGRGWLPVVDMNAAHATFEPCEDFEQAYRPATQSHPQSNG